MCKCKCRYLVLCKCERDILYAPSPLYSDHLLEIELYHYIPLTIGEYFVSRDRISLGLFRIGISRRKSAPSKSSKHFLLGYL